MYLISGWGNSRSRSQYILKLLRLRSSALENRQLYLVDIPAVCKDFGERTKTKQKHPLENIYVGLNAQHVHNLVWENFNM